ncbi:MAG: GGDEF domain-containing protein, partial [Rhodoferax sp.]|nr:GGDEF domain-containing protein [Rhodoferax sp.]
DALNATVVGHSNTDAETSNGQRAGRLKGAEFAMVWPGNTTALAAARAVSQSLLSQVLPQWAGQVGDLFHLGAVRYTQQQNLGTLLSSANQALAQAASKGPNSIAALEDAQAKPAIATQAWRALLTEAVEKGQLVLNYFPVLATDGKTVLHQEGMIRLKTDAAGSLMTAGDFMPMAAQLHLTAPLDLAVVRMVIGKLLLGSGDVAVNLSAETIADFHFQSQLALLLGNAPDLCQRLWFEVPEYGLYRQLAAFRKLAATLKALGCRVGVEHFGQQFTHIDQLADLALDYIKLQPHYVYDIANNHGNQEFLTGVCKVAHAMGITVIALGVEQAGDWGLLGALGFDGG